MLEKSVEKKRYFKLRLLVVDPGVRVLDCVREMGNERYYAGRKFKTVKEETIPRGTWMSRHPFTLVTMERNH